MATIRDISERKKAELDLVRRTNELAHSNIELEQFASIASHDLQEPLRTIGGFAQLLARRCSGQLDSPANEFIAYIVNGVTRMQTLINDLLEYSRLGTHGLAFRQVSCESVLERVLEDLNGSIARTGAVITHDALPEVWADRSQMSQLFQNLIANAIHYRANAPPRVHITAREEGDYWQFSVEDNGIGFDPKQSERIFVIFQRLHTTEQYPGSGMGLAVCRKIVERHFGRIWAESQPGKGSRFFFTLPGKDIRA
jgi:light-regulated signal transduction histidine kinase (bacteriophytochrome)